MDGTWADDSTVHIVAIRQAASFLECFIRLFAPAGIEIRAGEAHGTKCSDIHRKPRGDQNWMGAAAR